MEDTITAVTQEKDRGVIETIAPIKKLFNYIFRLSKYEKLNSDEYGKKFLDL